MKINKNTGFALMGVAITFFGMFIDGQGVNIDNWSLSLHGALMITVGLVVTHSADHNELKEKVDELEKRIDQNL